MGKKINSPATLGRPVNPAEEFLDPMESVIDERDSADSETARSPFTDDGLARLNSPSDSSAPPRDWFESAAMPTAVATAAPIDMTKAKPPPPLPRNLHVDSPRLKPLDTTLVSDWDFALPVYTGPLDESKIDMGYVPTRVDCDLTGPLGQMFKRLLLGCRNLHLTYRMNGRETHVETGADLVRYLVSMVDVPTGDAK